MEHEKESLLRRPSLAGIAPGHILISLVVNIVCPYMLSTEYSQRGMAWMGLLLAALFPLAGIAYAFIRHRVLDVIGVAALVVIGINLLAEGPGASIENYALVRALAIAAPLAVLGLAMLISQQTAHPLLYYADRFFSAGYDLKVLARYDAKWTRDELYRTWVGNLNRILAIVQIVLALIAAVVFYLLADWPSLLSLLFTCVVYIILAAWVQQRKQVLLQDDRSRIEEQ